MALVISMQNLLIGNVLTFVSIGPHNPPELL